MFHEKNYSISLEEAQKQKCEFVCEYLGITKGSKVLDLGCGWGGFLKHLENIGANGTGVSLSTGQLAACRSNGLAASLTDMRYITPCHLGPFDAVPAI